MSEKIDAILLAGGKGTRIEAVERVLPKSLIKLKGRELLRYSFDILPPAIIKRVIVALDYKADIIEDWLERANLPFDITAFRQRSIGLKNAVVEAQEMSDADLALVCNTDEIRIGLNVEEMVKRHTLRGRLATMAITNATHLFRHGHIKVNPFTESVLSLDLKPANFKEEPLVQGLVNTGLMLVEKASRQLFTQSEDLGWMGIIDPLIGIGQLTAFMEENMPYFNVGTPDEYREAELFLNGDA